MILMRHHGSIGDANLMRGRAIPSRVVAEQRLSQATGMIAVVRLAVADARAVLADGSGAAVLIGTAGLVAGRRRRVVGNAHAVMTVLPGWTTSVAARASVTPTPASSSRTKIENAKIFLVTCPTPSSFYQFQFRKALVALPTANLLSLGS